MSRREWKGRAAMNGIPAQLPAGVDGVAQRRRRLRRPESQACACSTPRRRAGRLFSVLPSPALPPLGPMRRKSSRVTWCPCKRGCAWPRGTGKPLQIAVDGVPGTNGCTSMARINDLLRKPEGRCRKTMAGR